MDPDAVVCPLCGHSLSQPEDDSGTRNAPLAVSVPDTRDRQHGHRQGAIDGLVDRARTNSRTEEMAIQCPKCEESLTLKAGRRNGELSLWFEDWL